MYTMRYISNIIYENGQPVKADVIRLIKNNGIGMSAYFCPSASPEKSPESLFNKSFPGLMISYLLLSRMSMASPKLKKRYFSRTASS